MTTLTLDCTACTGETCLECGGTGQTTDAVTETLRQIAARLYADVMTEAAR